MTAAAHPPLRWAFRLRAAFQAVDFARRLGRAAGYLRAGRVGQLDIFPGRFAAPVEGSRPRPYLVQIQVAAIPAADWVAARLAARPALLTELRAGRVGAEVEGLFAGGKARLIPDDLRTLRAYCTCPDSASPCKHIGAVFLAACESFDRDPLALLRWRGMPEEWLAQDGAAPAAPLAAAAASGPAIKKAAKPSRVRPRAPEPEPPPDLPADESYWRLAAPLPDEAIAEPPSGSFHDALPPVPGDAPRAPFTRFLAEAARFIAGRAQAHRADRQRRETQRQTKRDRLNRL